MDSCLPEVLLYLPGKSIANVSEMILSQLINTISSVRSNHQGAGDWSTDDYIAFRFHLPEKTMLKQLIALPILGLTLTAVAPANAATVEFNAILNGAQEVPGVNTPASGTATAILTGDPGSYVFTYTVSYSGLLGGIARPFAHIHNAPFGSNGPIVHDLDGANVAPIAGSTSGTITGDWRFDDAARPLTNALVQELLEGDLYFNIHTTFSAPGEIRGQISAVPTPTLLPGILGLGIGVLRKRQTEAEDAQA